LRKEKKFEQLENKEIKVGPSLKESPCGFYLIFVEIRKE